MRRYWNTTETHGGEKECWCIPFGTRGRRRGGRSGRKCHGRNNTYCTSTRVTVFFLFTVTVLLISDKKRRRDVTRVPTVRRTESSVGFVYVTRKMCWSNVTVLKKIQTVVGIYCYSTISYSCTIYYSTTIRFIICRVLIDICLKFKLKKKKSTVPTDLRFFCYITISRNLCETF